MSLHTSGVDITYGNVTEGDCPDSHQDSCVTALPFQIIFGKIPFAMTTRIFLLAISRPWSYPTT